MTPHGIQPWFTIVVRRRQIDALGQLDDPVDEPQQDGTVDRVESEQVRNRAAQILGTLEADALGCCRCHGDTVADSTREEQR